jgi:DNA-binding NarL/FixJ family response regulator
MGGHELTVIGCRFELEGEEYVLLGFPLMLGAEGPPLTTAERAILAFLLEGRTNDEIAGARGRSPRTVANQVASIFRKLGVASRRELLSKCTRGSFLR